MHTKEEKMQAFGRFLDVLDALRANCPWDKKQTNESLRPNTIEETYELCDALIKNDVHDICKELGDVLLHICFYAKIAEEKSQFDMADVCDALTRKMITRHPHVYHPSQIDAVDPKPLPYVPDNLTSAADGEKVTTVSQVLENWEQIKLKEKDGNESVLSGVPDALPSLIKAYRIQDKARNVGFDWEDRQDVWKKVREELAELEAELEKEDKERSTEELGDFIFSVINAARLYKLNPDNALEKTNRKFIDRFNYIEAHSIKIGKPLKDMTLEEMDALWNEAKVALR
jgi:XTP/dITP diphosphohydrolase